MAAPRPPRPTVPPGDPEVESLARRRAERDARLGRPGTFEEHLARQLERAAHWYRWHRAKEAERGRTED